MLQLYIDSVIIYMFIIWAETRIFTNPARDNGWMSAETAQDILSKKITFFRCFIIALVPIIRGIAVIIFIIIGTCKKEDSH